MKAVDVVGRILPREIWILFIEEHARVAAWEIGDRGCNLPAIGAIDEQRADAAGPEVETECIRRMVRCHAGILQRNQSRRVV